MNHKGFIKLASVACFLSVVTTVGIHAFFQFDAETFEQRLMLFQNPAYIVNKWWVIIHCLLVIISMWGFLLTRFRKSPGYAGLGFFFFGVFAVAEIFRQMLVFFYLNNLRREYLAAKDGTIKNSLAFSIDHFGLIGNSIFGLFILAFALGNLFYGLSLFGEKGYGGILSGLLLLWSLGSFMALGNEFWKMEIVDTILPIYSLWFQPLMRLLIAIWLWKSADMEASLKQSQLV